ncbi:hypothetical protein [Streptomyces sp. NPDC007088]|uniref:hypothetical protein n=1 Tax=Streptomyces sp. NPDC007088 TaxID=3364773 RepID=UPI0036AE4058
MATLATDRHGALPGAPSTSPWTASGPQNCALTDSVCDRSLPRTPSLVEELLTDTRVRAYLGGPLSHERVAARQAAYPQKADVWALVRSEVRWMRLVASRLDQMERRRGA